MVHWICVIVLKSQLEVNNSDCGKDRVRSELVLDDAPLLLVPVLIEEALDELRSIDLTRQSLQHRAERCEVLPISIEPFKVEHAHIDSSCGFVFVVLQLLLELFLPYSALFALHREDLALSWPVDEQDLPCALSLIETLIKFFDCSRSIVLNEEPEVVLTRQSLQQTEARTEAADLQKRITKA